MRQNKGKYILVTGCMFAGKTTRLIELSNVYAQSESSVRIYHPDTDTRNQPDVITSHCNVSIGSKSVSIDGDEIRNCSSPIILIDEIQFFLPSIKDVIAGLVLSGSTIVTAGLDKNHRGEYFKTTHLLESFADEVIRLAATCFLCGNPAMYTQRIRDGVCETKQDEEILPGGSDIYQARCAACFVSHHPKLSPHRQGVDLSAQ